MRAILAFGMAVAVFGAPLIAQDRSVAVDKILPTLALVIAPQANNTDMASTGTAFCFWSTRSKSFFLTNKHVVEGASEILLQLQVLSTTANRQTLYKARLFPSSLLFNDTDLAILVIDVSNVPHVVFDPKEPEIGVGIGIAGYPSFQFEPPNSPSGVTPSAHFGTINSVPFSNFDYVEFDATADHGNSGGPLFDSKTGDVLGVVTLGIQSQTSQAVQNNLALKKPSPYIYSVFLPYTERTPTGIKDDFPCQNMSVSTLQTEGLIPALDRQKFCSLPDAVGSPANN